MNSLKGQVKYGEEVIGKTVLIRFNIENGKHAWFEGCVKEAARNGDGILHDEVHHRIAFGDGEDNWYSLETLEENRELHWIRKIDEGEIDDAIGRRVLIEFPIQNKKTAWFQGNVCFTRTSMVKKGEISFEHLVVYDAEGEEHWLDLRLCAKRGGMQFLGNSVPCGASFKKPEPKSVVIKKETGDASSLKRKPSGQRQHSTPGNKRNPKIKEEREDAKVAVVDWTRGMEKWLRRTWENPGKGKIAQVMKQVRMLASGAGVRCKSWDINRRAFIGTEVNLSSNLPRLIEHAKSFQEEFGMDTSAESDLIVPLEQILCYKKSLLDSEKLKA